MALENKGSLTEKEREDLELKEKIFELFNESRGSYGSRKITALINTDREYPVNYKRIERIMRENDLFSKTRKKYTCTTDSDHEYPIAPNKLDRDFSASSLFFATPFWYSYSATYIR